VRARLRVFWATSCEDRRWRHQRDRVSSTGLRTWVSKRRSCRA
jgi:hypothetical protein